MIKEWLRGKSIVIVCNLEGFDRYLIYDLICKYNCKITCICQNKQNMNIFEEKFEEYSDKINFICFNTTVESEWKNFSDTLISSTRNIDVLINVNEEDEVCYFEDLRYEDFENSMSNNFYKVVHSIRYLLPIIKYSRTPSIITVLNLKCLSTQKGLCHYASSTIAVKNFLETLAEEYEEIYFSIMFTTNTQKILSDSNKRNYTYFIKTATSIIKAINRKNKKAYIGNRAKLFRYLNKISPKISKRLL